MECTLTVGKGSSGYSGRTIRVKTYIEQIEFAVVRPFLAFHTVCVYSGKRVSSSSGQYNSLRNVDTGLYSV